VEQVVQVAPVVRVAQEVRVELVAQAERAARVMANTGRRWPPMH
jgi:hypothetical protein